LGNLRDGRAFDPLMSLLHDEDPQIRRWTIEALGKIGDKRIVDPLITVLAGGPTQEERNAAARALGRIGDKRAIEVLISALADDDLRWSAATALGQLGDKRGVDLLIRGLDVEYPPDDVIFGLVYSGEAAFEPLIHVLWNGSSLARRNAARVVRQIRFYWRAGIPLASPNAFIRQAVEPLIDTLKDKDEIARAFATIVLGDIGDQRALQPLLGMAEDDSQYVRWCLIHMLKKFGDAIAIPVLEWLRQNDSGGVNVYYDTGDRWEANRDEAAKAIEHIKAHQQ
jgi:HEAT repeat protein